MRVQYKWQDHHTNNIRPLPKKLLLKHKSTSTRIYYLHNIIIERIPSTGKQMWKLKDVLAPLDGSRELYLNKFNYSTNIHGHKQTFAIKMKL